ncbi:MAG: SHOCT domain-containing protein [Lachnospiraceae bacterium]|nr:SHOCT domain-containing protein [Lachnospiraceae bacterium]
MSKNIKVKPGKGQSMTGFVGGLIFCAIGLFIAIPTFGLFGILWTLFAVVITVMNGMNAFTDKGVPTHEITIEDERGHSASSAESSSGISRSAGRQEKGAVEERLQKVEDLYQRGLISSEEREQKRREILEEI